MSYSLEKLKELRGEFLEELTPRALARIEDPRFSRGGQTNSVIDDYEFIALADYVLDKNISSYREYMHKCVLLMLDLIERWKSGDESVDFKYVWAQSKPIAMAMITGDFALVQKLIELLNPTIISQKKLKQWEIWGAYNYRLICYTCGGFGDEKSALDALELLRASIKNKGPRKAYLDLMESIIRKDQLVFDAAMDGVLKSHKFHCRKGQWFCDGPDQLLSHAGVRNATIGVIKGMEFNLDCEEIPKDLVLGLAELAKTPR